MNTSCVNFAINVRHGRLRKRSEPLAEIVETNRVDGVWKILLKGSLLSLLWGTLLFCIVPTIAIRLMSLVGGSVR